MAGPDPTPKQESDTRRRLAGRQRFLMILPALFGLRALVDVLTGTASASAKALQILAYVVLIAALIPVFLLLQRRGTRRVSSRHADALFAGVATAYVDQVARSRTIGASVAGRRQSWTSFLTMGQGIADGELVVRPDELSWSPMRLARWLRLQGWTLNRAEVVGIELNDPPTPVKGRNVVVTLTLDDGTVLDMTLRDRAGFVAGWERTQVDEG